MDYKLMLFTGVIKPIELANNLKPLSAHLSTNQRKTGRMSMNKCHPLKPYGKSTVNPPTVKREKLLSQMTRLLEKDANHLDHITAKLLKQRKGKLLISLETGNKGSIQFLNRKLKQTRSPHRPRI